MKKLFIIPLICLLVWGGFKLNFILYEKLADKRIKEVAELQGASIQNSEILINGYDYKNRCWYQEIVFNDDPEISYEYKYIRLDNQVRVFASYKNMSLDLANKQAKYPLYDIYFKGDKVIEVNEH